MGYGPQALTVFRGGGWHSLSDEITPVQGVKQGCIVSPLSFAARPSALVLSHVKVSKNSQENAKELKPSIVYVLRDTL